MRAVTTLLLSLGAGLSLPAQGFQCQHLGNFNVHGPFNDVWGFVGTNGKEYALLGASTGTVVVDCSNPAAPVERGWLPWQNSLWRDLRYHNGYAFVVTEAGSSNGFQVIDLTNPDSPSVVGVFGGGAFSSSHNVTIDPGTARLYLPGADTGTPAFDISNPASPVYLGLAGGSGSGNYFHDLCVENGYGYGSMIYNGVLRIWDMSTFPPTVLSDVETPTLFTHNAWPNAAGTLCVTTDERAGGVVRFFDVSNKAAPIARGQVTPNGATIPHNAFLIGDICHASWYTTGYQCIDVSDPTTPIVVASYDTFPANDGGTYDGAWGCYPFQPSGNIYISDRSTGLHIVKPQLTDLAIAHTPLADTGDETGPYVVTADLTSSYAISSATLYYRVGGAGAFTSVPMTPTAQPGQYQAGIPGHDAAVNLEYHIDAVDSQALRRSPRIGEHRFLVGTEVTRWSDDFEVDLGWTHGGSTDDWQRGAISGRAGASNGRGFQDPVLAASGATVWGNDIGPSGFNGAYPGNSSNWLQSPSIPTGSVQGLRLGFQRRLSLAAGDTATVKVNGQVVWTTSSDTEDGYWQPVDYDISAIANSQSSVVVRFELTTDGSVVAGGWTIDDVRLFTRHDCVPPVHYGTATPGTGGVEPQIDLSAAAQLGTTADVTASQLLPSSLAVFAFNEASFDAPVSGVHLNVDPGNIVLQSTTIDGAGATGMPLPIPLNPALDGYTLYAQVFGLDAGAPGGLLSGSMGMRFRLCVSAP